MYCRWSKRIFDIIVGTIILLIFLPLILIVAILTKIFLGSPILFSQWRPGLNEKPFCLHKFRTMRHIYDKNGHLLDDKSRLTTFGKVIRSLSLDELPELINVLKGEMSLVGPRPLLMEYLPYYSKEQRVRHQVRPGLTGWAQINGRNELSWQKKFELDIWYVRHCSFMLDIKIIFLTIVTLIKREGIHATGEATMTRFDLESKQNLNDILRGEK